MWARFSWTHCLAGVVLGWLSLPANCPAQVWFSAADAATERERQHLEFALSQRTSVDFVETPLRDVVDTLGRQFQVPLTLSPKKLDEASISQDTPVTIRFENLPLESILRLMLKQLELNFTIRDSVILISTAEDIESELETRVYPVRDLVEVRYSSSKTDTSFFPADYDSLIELITTTLQPDSWDDVGGPGAIDSSDNAVALVISQTRDVHLQVEGLLEALRRAKVFQGLASFPMSTLASRTVSPRSTASQAAATIVTSAAAWQLPRIHAADQLSAQNRKETTSWSKPPAR